MDAFSLHALNHHGPGRFWRLFNKIIGNVMYIKCHVYSFKCTFPHSVIQPDWQATRIIIYATEDVETATQSHRNYSNDDMHQSLPHLFFNNLKQRTDIQLTKPGLVIISRDFLVDGAFSDADFHRTVDYWNTLIVNWYLSLAMHDGMHRCIVSLCMYSVHVWQINR